MSTLQQSVYGIPLQSSGVGSNAPSSLTPQQTQFNQEQQNKATGQVLGTVGKAIDTIGKATGNILPELNVSENLQRLGGMLNPKPVYATDGTNIDAIVNAMVSKGYDRATARAVATAEPDRFAKEYLGSSSGSDSGSQSPQVSNDQLAAAYRAKTGSNPTPGSLDDIRKLFESTGDFNSAIDRIAQRDIDSANENYKAKMELLSAQKGELSRFSEEQRDEIERQRALGLEETAMGRARDVGDIEAQKRGFETKYESDKNTLAENWRALSMKTQALMRARGVTSSDFAQQAESKQMQELNQGLRALAVSSNEAYMQFAEAVRKTNEYYNYAEKKLNSDAQANINRVNSWLQSAIVDIQGQERLSLAQKLTEINNAANKADAMRIQYQEQLDAERRALETWLYQTKVSFDNTLKLAAAGNVQSAQTSLSDSIKLANSINEFIQESAVTGTGAVSGGGFTSSLIGGMPGLQKDEYGNSIIPLANPQQTQTYLENFNKTPQVGTANWYLQQGALSDR